MADKKRPSVAEILAAARRLDNKSGAPAEEPAAEAPPSDASPEISIAPAEEISSVEPPAVEPIAAEVAAEPVAEPPAPAAKPAAKPAGGARPSVAEMLAMARGEKSAAAAAPSAKPAAEKPAAAKPAAADKGAAAKTAAAKAKPSAPATAAPGSAAAKPVKDTASILAAARGGTKPGPVSKAVAAAREGVAKEKEIKVTQSKVTVPPMPVKPAAAKPKPKEKAPADEERRGFMQLLFGSFLAVGFTSLSAATGLWTLGLARFMFPNILTEPPSRFKVGFPSDFPPGSVEEKYKALFGVWIVNTEVNGAREIFALRTVCTHLGCTPNWLEGEQKFKCPCHGSGFYKDGINFEGPAPRPLERYSIRLADDGQLEVDKSKLFQVELGQWTDPASFVAV